MDPSVEARARFIPLTKAEVVALLCNHAALSDEERPKFAALCELVGAIFHFGFHRKVEALKAHYAPFDPDRAVPAKPSPDDAAHARALVSGIAELLNDANYEKLTDAELAHALNEESVFNVSLFVDFDDFAEHLVFTRGHRVQRSEIRKFVFWKETIDVPTFERVTMYVRFKEKSYFTSKKRKRLEFTPGSTLLKLFKDVPKADLEMLFPNTQVRMKLRDKLILGVPGLVGGAVFMFKAGASLLAAFVILFFLVESEVEKAHPHQYPWPDAHRMALVVGGLTAVIGLIGFVFKQYTAYKNRKLAFMKALTDNLYFRNLDNNGGVFLALTDAAEEEECKEALLAYFFLRNQKDQTATEAELDARVERWLADEHDVRIDFEVDDAMRKLKELALVEAVGEGYRAVPLDEACRRLDAQWDNYFQFAGPASASS